MPRPGPARKPILVRLADAGHEFIEAEVERVGHPFTKSDVVRAALAHWSTLPTSKRALTMSGEQLRSAMREASKTMNAAQRAWEASSPNLSPTPVGNERALGAAYREAEQTYGGLLREHTKRLRLMSQ